MTARHPPRASGLLITIMVMVAAVGGCATTPEGGDHALDRPQRTSPTSGTQSTSRATDAATHFLDTYVEADGRVVRPGQGGDTVSEGQAYALLAAVAVGDQQRFDDVWRWTRANLRRDDGLLAFHWADGEVVDPSPAADADLDATRALVLASERFGDDGYRRQASGLASAVLAHETVEVGDGRVLAAGPWATGSPSWINPSYLSPRAFGLLAASLDDPRWQDLHESSYRVVDALTDTSTALPPDWARARASGELRPVPAPQGDGRSQYGYDAVRVPLRFGADCSPRGRELAARMWPFLREEATSGLVDVYGLDGERLGEGPHAVSLVAVAGAAHAAGDAKARDDLLGRAEDLDREHPSYYGAALVALGRVLLTTDLLDECP